jgi:hypothetical protein
VFFVGIIADRMGLTQNELMIGIFGYVSGTYKGLTDRRESHYYRIPAFWKAVIKQGKIQHWQVCCETKKVEAMIYHPGEKENA